MVDYIDRQAARHALGNVVAEGATPQELVRNYIDIVLGRIEALPSASAVEVVRCRDCEHYFTSNLEMAKNHGAECTMMNRRTMPEDYCSYGQKM